MRFFHTKTKRKARKREDRKREGHACKEPFQQRTLAACMTHNALRPPWLENKTLRAIQGPLVHSRPSSWSVQWASCGLYNVQIDPSGLWMKSSMTYTIWYLGLMGFSCLSLKMPRSVWREHTCAPLFSSSIFFIKFLSDVTSCACIASHPNKFSKFQGTYTVLYVIN